MSLILPLEGELSFKIIVAVFCASGHHFNINILDYLFFPTGRSLCWKPDSETLFQTIIKWNSALITTKNYLEGKYYSHQ